MTLKVIEGAFNADAEVSHARAVEFMEETMERCKTERAVFVQVLMLLPDGAVLDGWSDAKSIRPYVVVGAMEEIKHRFMVNNIERR